MLIIHVFQKIEQMNNEQMNNEQMNNEQMNT